MAGATGLRRRAAASAACSASLTCDRHWTLVTRASAKQMPSGGDADLGALLRQALAEEEDEQERGRGDERDDPGVVEHLWPQPFITAMSSRSMLRRLR